MSDPKRTSELQELFYRQWWEDTQEGITLRSVSKTLAKHLEEDEDFQRGALERLVALETNEKRDAEARLLNGNGKGRHTTEVHVEIPPPPRVPSLGPWWSRDPWKSAIKYILIGIAGLVIGWLSRHLGVVAPH